MAVLRKVALLGIAAMLEIAAMLGIAAMLRKKAMSRQVPVTPKKQAAPMRALRRVVANAVGSDTRISRGRQASRCTPPVSSPCGRRSTRRLV